ncbi:MAG: hypothetical protein J6Y78_16060 [Paludibacteraceae bacterium]|nr:hypothetical protein [Paludibacteraceae bacterium]
MITKCYFNDLDFVEKNNCTLTVSDDVDCAGCVKLQIESRVEEETAEPGVFEESVYNTELTISGKQLISAIQKCLSVNG